MLTRDFAWNDWANREALSPLRKAGDAPARAVGLLGHCVGTGRLWRARILGEEGS
jgi:hypothetical protein